MTPYYTTEIHRSHQHSLSLPNRHTGGQSPFFCTNTRLTITCETITCKIRDAIFVPPAASRQSASLSIRLFLTARNRLEADGFPISGFPRRIIRQSSDYGFYSRPHPSGPRHWRGGSGRGSSTVSECVISHQPEFGRRSAGSSSSSAGTWSRLMESMSSHIRPCVSCKDSREAVEGPCRRDSATTLSGSTDMVSRIRSAGSRTSRFSYTRISRIGQEAIWRASGGSSSARTSLLNGEHTFAF